MKFNESLLKSKIKENLKGIKNDLDREGKATAIAEALNFFDSKRDWVTKINRDEIISLITNSPSQDVLCESIIEKVNATPFSKSLKESKKKKESKKLNESVDTRKPLKEGDNKTTFTLSTGNTPILDAGLYYSWLYDIMPSKADQPKRFKEFEECVMNEALPILQELVSKTDGFEVVSVDNYYHPKYYNYETDELDFTVKYNGDNLGDVIEQYSNNPEFIEFLKNYKSYDGFISFYADTKDDFITQEPQKSVSQIIRFNVGKDDIERANEELYYNVSDCGFFPDDDYDDEDNFDESLDVTQKLIDNAKKFAKENGKDVKVTGLVNSNECAIDTFPEDFDEMVKLFNTKFDVYDEDSELERFKIKAKSTNESLNEEVTGMAKEFIKELKEFKQFQIDRIKEQNGYDYDDVDIDVGGQDYDDCVDELLDIAQFYDREFDNLTHTIESKVKDCVDYGMSIFEIVDYLIRDCKSEFNENLQEGKIKIKDEIQRLVDKYSRLQKQYHGDSSASKNVEAEIDRLQCLLDRGKEYIDESLKEGYYDYMDKDYADILDKDVDVYDIKQFVLNDTNNEFRTHYSDEFALITCPNGKGCVVDYEAVGQDFDSLDSEIEFGIEENKDSEYTDENGKTHKTIRIFASHILTTTPKEVMEKAPKKTMKYRDFFRKYKYNDRCANNFSELVSYIKENGGLQEGCHSKKKKTLKEGYLGQTLEDFFYDCVDPEVIETVSLWGDNDEIYSGDYDGAIDEYGSNEFIEFDCGMGKVVINVDTSEEYQVTDYFIDVQDFVDCFNGDEIEVYDIHTGETLFSGDRYELPDDVAEKIFVSFDAPKFISINIEEDGDRFDDDDDFDENLKESLEDDMEKLPHVVSAYKDGGKYILELQWRPTTRKTHSDYVDISQALNNKYGKDNVNIKCKKQDWRDGNKETRYILEVGLKDKSTNENLKEDTVKQDGKWVNKGNTGETHGEFKTKKEADKQRKAMFVNKKPNAKWGK